MAGRGVVTAFLAEGAIITWRNVARDHNAPPPSQYVGAAVIYGLLGLLPDSAGPAAAAFGWALVVATFINLWDPAAPMHLQAPGSSAPAPPVQTTLTVTGR